MSQLSKNFTPQFKLQLEKLCGKYIDIFRLTIEPVSATNLYKQKLRLIDDERVYYRNLNTQIDEIQAQVQ